VAGHFARPDFIMLLAKEQHDRKGMPRWIGFSEDDAWLTSKAQIQAAVLAMR
jgi:hypothetical protein